MAVKYPFNVRAYGLMISEDRKLLVTDERYEGNYLTKFPGGGLEFGEGLRDCVKREFMEECGLTIRVGEHVYTTDFFQPSAFDNREQVISVYFRVYPIEDQWAPFLSIKERKNYPRFRWISLSYLDESVFSLPIDRYVAHLLKRLP